MVVGGLVALMLINPDTAFSTMLDGSRQAINLCVELWAVYAVWLGVLKIIEDTGLDKVFGKILQPIIRMLFPGVDEYAANQIAINITSNILGMGNACTPSGINAIAGMDKGGNTITTNMSLLVIFNTTNIQLIPTTIIGIRILHGSLNASSIIFPTIITSLSTLLIGIILAKICGKVFLKGDN